MRRRSIVSLKELINQNKTMILNNQEELKKIDERLENKKMKTRSQSK